MQIAILGGTGAIGEGLALRWSRDAAHEILIGSRDEDRARDAVSSYEDQLRERGLDGSISGYANRDAAERGDVVILSVPPYYVADTIEAIEDVLADSVLVSPAVGFERDKAGFHYDPPRIGSLTAYADQAAPEDVPVVGAFHTIPAARLSALEEDLEFDTPVVGDDAAATEMVIDLVDEIDGLRGIDAGGIANAPEVESVVPLLLNVSENSDLHDIGIRFG